MIDKKNHRYGFQRLWIFEDINCQKCAFKSDDVFIECKYLPEMQMRLWFEDIKYCPYYHASFTVLFKKYFYKLLPGKYREYPITREESVEFHKDSIKKL